MTTDPYPPIPPEEVDLHLDQDEEGHWIARVYHRPSTTIKISDYFWDKEDAVEQVMRELQELLHEKKQGLGRKRDF